DKTCCIASSPSYCASSSHRFCIVCIVLASFASFSRRVLASFSRRSCCAAHCLHYGRLTCIALITLFIAIALCLRHTKSASNGFYQVRISKSKGKWRLSDDSESRKPDHV
ncbi:hypothetical protein F4604DRAFT_459246, partial [Suillus subluteus]